jgi:hypothetical protein
MKRRGGEEEEEERLLFTQAFVRLLTFIVAIEETGRNCYNR